MGLQRWLLKNGPGSPGSTSKFFSNYYKRLAEIHPETEWQTLFYVMYEDRVKTTRRLDPQNKAQGLYEQESPEVVVMFSQGDICLFTFMMLYLETDQFRRGIAIGEEGFNVTLEVIREVVKSIIPDMNKLDYDEYKERAADFCNNINHRLYRF